MDEKTGRPVRVVINAAGGLRPSDMRRLPWKSWFAFADSLIRDPDLVRYFPGQDDIEIPSIDDELDQVRPKHPGRRGHSDEHYAAVARRYSTLVSAGYRDPTATIAREHHVARPTASGWIRQARDRRLLAPARRGKAG